jgi:formate hydrogenlyase subunit 3/multisubunit Na+/H+ antiporter MnhD subunit
MPPFGLFVSEFFVLTAAFNAARHQVAALLLVSLSVVFGALIYHFQGMLLGEPEGKPAHPKWLRSEFAVIGACTAGLLVLGVRVPSVVTNLVHVAMGVLQ